MAGERGGGVEGEGECLERFRRFRRGFRGASEVGVGGGGEGERGI